MFRKIAARAQTNERNSPNITGVAREQFTDKIDRYISSYLSSLTLIQFGEILSLCDFVAEKSQKWLVGIFRNQQTITHARVKVIFLRTELHSSRVVGFQIWMKIKWKPCCFKWKPSIILLWGEFKKFPESLNSLIDFLFNFSPHSPSRTNICPWDAAVYLVLVWQNLGTSRQVTPKQLFSHHLLNPCEFP